MQPFEIDFPGGISTKYATRTQAIQAAMEYTDKHPTALIMIYLHDKNDTIVTARGAVGPDGGF
jgi:hypothetical protein